MTSPADDQDPRVARTRQAVHEAVRSLVQRAGFEAVSHQQGAEEAGIGRATVYRHWPNRTDLLLDALAGIEAPRRWATSGDLAADLTSELPADLDLDTATARLAGPLFYQRLLAHGRLDEELVTRIVTTFVEEQTGRT